MKNRYRLCLGMVLCALISCGKTEVRRYVSVKSTSSIKRSAQRNKLLLKHELEEINKILTKDTMVGFKKSTNGFIYRYLKQHKEAKKVSEGDRLKFIFDTRTIDGNIIYSKMDNGVQSLVYNKDDLIFIGLRQTLSLMREGDTIQAFFPSSIAYGYHGDEEKIKSNTPIFCEIILLDILKKNEK